MNGTWPDGVFAHDAPEAVAYAIEIARNLAAALGGRTKVSVAEAADVQRTTIYDLLGGRSWADLVTLAKLDEALGVRLLPPDVPPLNRVPPPPT